MNLKFGNCGKHAAGSASRLSAVFSALPLRGGDGLRDAFHERGFDDQSIRDGKMIGIETRCRSCRGFRAFDQRVHETHGRAMRNE